MINANLISILLTHQASLIHVYFFKITSVQFQPRNYQGRIKKEDVNEASPTYNTKFKIDAEITSGCCAFSIGLWFVELGGKNDVISEMD